MKKQGVKGEKSDKEREHIQTVIIDDVFTDVVEMVKPRFEVNYDAYLDRLWDHEGRDAWEDKILRDLSDVPGAAPSSARESSSSSTTTTWRRCGSDRGSTSTATATTCGRRRWTRATRPPDGS